MRKERLSPSFHSLQYYSVVKREAKDHLIQVEKVKCLISDISNSESITFIVCPTWSLAEINSSSPIFSLKSFEGSEGS